MRYLNHYILSDLDKKIVLLAGPRQVGKTTLAKSLPVEPKHYLNFDEKSHRLDLLNKNWPRRCSLVIFDELHKMPKWKSWLKGIYDTEGIPPQLLVTGSARLETFKKAGDSLAGRHFLYHLHPFSVAELKDKQEPQEILQGLLRWGGFPEPYFSQSDTAAARWRISHLDSILRQDLLDLEQVRNLVGIETLVELLAERVGSPISFRSLAEDLQVTPQTVQRWVVILEKLYVIFLVRPFSKNLARALLKEPKIYFFDTGKVKNEAGCRLENAVACALLKANEFLRDTRGEAAELFYIRDKEKREVDFLLTKNKIPEWLIEVKTSDQVLSTSLKYFSQRLPSAKAVQLVLNLEREKIDQHGSVLNAASWLAQLPA